MSDITPTTFMISGITKKVTKIVGNQHSVSNSLQIYYELEPNHGTKELFCEAGFKKIMQLIG